MALENGIMEAFQAVLGLLTGIAIAVLVGVGIFNALGPLIGTLIFGGLIASGFLIFYGLKKDSKGLRDAGTILAVLALALGVSTCAIGGAGGGSEPDACSQLGGRTSFDGSKCIF